MADIYNLVKAMSRGGNKLSTDENKSGEYLALEFAKNRFDAPKQIELLKLLGEHDVPYSKDTREGLIDSRAKTGTNKRNVVLITRDDFLAKADDWLEQLGEELEYKYGEDYPPEQSSEYMWLKKKIAFFRDPSQWKPMEETEQSAGISDPQNSVNDRINRVGSNTSNKPTR